METPRSYRSTLKSLKRAVALVWEADARSAILVSGFTVVSGLLPVSQAWVAKLIIDAVVKSVQEKVSAIDAFHSIVPYLAVEFGLILIGSIIVQITRLLYEVLDHKIGFQINSNIIRKALLLELHYFENAEFYDKMQNARKQSEYRAIAIIKAIFQFVENSITLISFLTLLLSFSVWMTLLLFGAAFPAFVAQNKLSRLNFRLQGWKAPESRKMVYYEHLLTVDSSAKEIQTFGLGEPLLKRRAEIFWKVFKEDVALAWKQSWTSLGWGLVSSGSYYVCYAWVVFRTLSGLIGIGSMALYLSIFRQSQGTFNGIFDSLSKIYENSLFMENLFDFLDLPELKSVPNNSEFKPDPSQGIEFQDVSFQYHGQEKVTLHHLNLTIRPGERVALVGENGSGKTTLIKLLTRLYEPTSGKILYQGISLQDWPRDELRKKIGVIFQDFVRYQLTVKENVGFGSVESSDEQAKIESAAERGGMLELIDEFPDRWDTMLGGWFAKGRELSGGQWQKIALSRAFMRDGEVIVLDEPTSALDAEKEYEIFKRFKELTTGKIAFLISHRFSTVRMADRIIVLKQGSIIEQGTHAELVKQNGVYAGLFELQAEGYR
jgi:ATP-binding cassette subfamily B protein